MPFVDAAPTAFRQQLLGAIPRLRRYARSLVFDTSAADDLVQTALERALAHWHQFDQRRDILVWTISIAHNAFMDERRRHARLPIVEPRDGHPGPEEWLAANSPDIGIDTDMVKPSKAKYDALIEGGLTVIKRFGKPEEVARIAVTLANGLLPYTSGQAIQADGGLLTVRY